MADGNPSPGWYQDPRDAGLVRWWDGSSWTQQTRQMPGAGTVAGSAEPSAPPAREQTAAAESDPWAKANEPAQPTQAAQPQQEWGQQPQQGWGQPEPQWPQQPAQPSQQQGWGQPEQQWGQAPGQPEQQWGQQPAQPEQQWGQQPTQPEQPQQGWGQQPAQPEQQWGEQPAQPEQQWGQQPAQPEQQWGQQPAQQQEPEHEWGQQQGWGQQQPQQQWGQQPGQPQQQWGQQPAQPEQQWGQQPGQAPQWGEQGGWQQPPGAWGSAVPPAPMPSGIAPGSPMGQTNVFPTAETVDPITGMPVGYDSGAGDASSTDLRRLALIVGATLLIGIVIIGLLWFFLFRGSGSDSAGGTTGEVEVTATYTGTVDPACADLGDALTAEGLSATVSQRLNEVAAATNLEENQAYFDQLAKDIKPIMQQYRTACEAAVAAGDAPEFYRTFVTTFDTAVTDGSTVSSAALANNGVVPPADAERLRSEASTLTSSAKAVSAITGVPEPSAPVPSPTSSSLSSAAPTAPAPSGAAVAPTPSISATQ